jgi:hydrogenase expression/formation protein HypE
MNVPAGPRITLAHGAGGPTMRALIAELFVDQRREPSASADVVERAIGGDRPRNNGHGAAAAARGVAVGLEALDDGAAIDLGDGRFLVLTTDSHVVHPRFFPGGDIGRLAVAGTVNDLAVMGATEPLALTCAVILEEGFSRAELEQVQASIAATCEESGAIVVTGDTKVMGRGEVDGLVINTAGVAITRRVVRDCGLAPGDRILVTGTVGDHGLAVLCARRGLQLTSELASDVAPINGLLRLALEAAGDDIVAMKDATRGGLAAVLHEMAGKSGTGIVLDEAAVPITEAARAAGELLGIDPLHVANEGKAVLVVRAPAVPAVLAALRSHRLGVAAAEIGTVVAEGRRRVLVDTGFGRRQLAEPDGELLPRIC